MSRGASRREGLCFGYAPLSRIETIDVPVCSEAEQEAVVQAAERLLAIGDVVEEQLSAAHDRTGQLDQAILAKAFLGELVPQDPNDEPASVMLERIRAEREKASPKKRKSRRRRESAQESAE